MKEQSHSPEPDAYRAMLAGIKEREREREREGGGRQAGRQTDRQTEVTYSYKSVPANLHANMLH